MYIFKARRRVAAKRKKLKNLGKSKSTDTEDEDADEDCGDEGELHSNFLIKHIELSSIFYAQFIFCFTDGNYFLFNTKFTER